MAKVINELVQDDTQASKVLNIQHTSIKTDVSGNEVEVVEWTEQINADEAIANCENHKAQLEAQLAACEAELADMIAIRDAE
jgi:hypothetical protein